MVRDTLADWLRSEFTQARVLTTGSGEEALVLADQTPPTLALIDIGLPGMTGLEAARQLKAGRADSHVIIISIHEAAQYRQEAARLGVSGFIPKRFIHTDLMPLMRRLLLS